MPVTPDIVRLAHSLADRVADVLSTGVVLTTESGDVLATSGDTAAVNMAPLTFPLRLNGLGCRLSIADTIGGEPVSPRVRRLLVELAVDQAALLLRLPNQEALKDRFIHELLKGPTGSEADALREGQILGMELTRPRAVLLVDASAYLREAQSLGVEQTLRRRAQVVIASIVRYFQLPDDTICAHIGAGEIAVLKAIRREDLASWLDRTRPQRASGSWANVDALKSAAAGLRSRLAEDTSAEIAIGVGRYHPRIKGLARSYQDASAALTLGRRLYGAGKVYSLDELGAAAFIGVADDRTRRELAERLLSPLDDDPELSRTLARFFERDCSIVDTARDLGLHRNTLGYRLDKIAQRTDLDPRRFGDAVQLRLAMLVRSVGDEARTVVRADDKNAARDAKVRAAAQVVP